MVADAGAWAHPQPSAIFVSQLITARVFRQSNLVSDSKPAPVSAGVHALRMACDLYEAAGLGGLGDSHPLHEELLRTREQLRLHRLHGRSDDVALIEEAIDMAEEVLHREAHSKSDV